VRHILYPALQGDYWINEMKHSITFQKTKIWVVSIFTPDHSQKSKVFFIWSYNQFLSVFLYEVLVAVAMKSTVIWDVTLQIRQSLTFGKNVSPPFSWSKSKPNKKQVQFAACCCLGLLFESENGGDTFL
jgi:hypothetical protein